MSPELELPHYEVHDGQGPYVLLVHGLLSSRSQWLLNLEALATRVRPVVVELYGHGRSPSPGARGAYHPDAYVAAFERIRCALGVEDWFLIGQSLGAALSLRYALTHPERIRAHVLTNSNSAFAEPGWMREVEPQMQGMRELARIEGRSALEKLPVHPRHARRLPPEAHAALVRDSELHDPEGVGLSAVETVVHSPLGHRLAENRVRSLLVVGRYEKRFQPHLERARVQMPSLEVVELDGGHAINLEAAADFNAHVVRFLDRSE